MKKSKMLGLLMIISAVVLIGLVVGFAVIFSVFGIKSGGSILMIAPLVIIAIIIVIALLGLLYAGIKFMKE